MGNGKLCDCCLEFTSLLQSYDTKRTPLNTITDVNISREEIETVILYMQSWTQRQCNCCFRDCKNFERYNWALQVLILVVVEILKHYHDNKQEVASEGKMECAPSVIPAEDPSASSSSTPGAEETEPEPPIEFQPKFLWDVEDKEKLIQFIAKVFQANFPTYVAFKQHPQMRADEVSQQDLQSFGLFCELNEPDLSPNLYRNVTLFCRAGGLLALQQFMKNQTPDTLPLHIANMIVGLGTTVKASLNFPALLNFFVPFRASLLGYLSKLVDTELKTTSARNMNEFIWAAVKDPIDAHLSFDRDGLDLAFKYFLSSTLTMRLSGVTQITNHINLLNELLNSDNMLDSDSLEQHLNQWLIENQIMEHMFGPNLHVEVIKQSHTLLTFLAIEGKITKEHIDIMWAAAQLKHCSRTVYDVLSLLIGNLDPDLVLHLRDLLLKLEPKDHTEASLFLTTNLTKFMWNNAAATFESPLIVPDPPTKYTQRLRHMSNMVDSSSENSVSIAGSHSDDEIQPLQLPRVLDTCNMVPRLVGDENKPPKTMGNHRMTNLRQLCKVVTEDTSDDDSVEVSGGESGKSDEQENVQVSSSCYADSHSDSDADAEKSGNEESPNKARRRVLRRRKSKSKSREGSGDNEGKGDSVVRREPSCVDISGDEPMLATPSSDKENDSGQTKMDVSSGSGSGPDLLEPNAVMTELSNLVQMTESPMVQEVAPNLLDNSDAGSYSSRMSTKSEKNMADFDGEESICEDEVMQSLSQNQLAELATRNGTPVRLSGIGPVYGPVRPFNRRRRPASSSGLNFQIDNVCAPGQTILWDLIQDDKIIQLPEGLALEVQKALSTLLCYNSDKRIKFKFIEGCIQNLTLNKSIVVSLRLLPKLLSSYPQPRTSETYQVTLWVDREYQMRNKFFENLKVFKDQDTNYFPFPYQAHLQVRLEFLSVLFANMTSPEEFRLSIDHLDILWDCLATDPRSADDLFIWMSGQVRIREQHALSASALRHIFIKKLPSLPPETVTMHALTLFQQLCNIARASGLQDIEAAAASMDYLWKIALCALRTDVSMAAIQYLNGYYINRQLEKEDEFIERCMSHLGEATEELTHCTSDEAPLLRIQRALLLLKTHLETFRRRYAYHLRKWYLEGRGVGSHAQLVGEKGAVPIKVVIQPAGWHEKATLELQSTDYVADLRAEVAKWWETIQVHMAAEKNIATPVLGSLLTEGPIRMITQGIELSAEYDEKCIGEVPIKDMQLVYVSPGAGRSHKKKDSMEYSSSLLPPPRDKLPVTLLLQMRYFEQLFSLTQSLAALKTSDRAGEAQPHTKGQVLSRRVWDILMLLPTNPAIHEGIANSMQSEENSFRTLLDPASPQKLMYSLYIVEALVKMSPAKSKDVGASGSGNAESVAWRQHFVEKGGLRHLFDIFASGVLESMEGGDWSEWKQDCLASLLKILCFLGIMTEDTDCLNEQLYDVNEISRKKAKRRKFSNDRSPIPRLNETMLAMMDVNQVMTRLTNILQACSLPRDPNHYKTGFWGRAQVVHYAMALLVCWAFSQDEVKAALYSQKDFPQWLRRLVLEDPEPAVRREVCTGLYRLCLGISSDGKTGTCYAPELISHLLQCLMASLAIKPQIKHEVQVQNYDDGKEPYGPACRDYFWLLGRLLDCLEEDFVKESIENPDSCVIDLDGLAHTLSTAIVTREYYETRHNTGTDDALVGLLTTSSVVMKHGPPFKTSKEGQDFLKQVFDCLFALPSPQMRYLPKCKSLPCRSAAFDLLTELGRNAVHNYYLLQNLLLNQHQPTSHSPYYWDYWPHEDGRSTCGYVGLTNLGATCYMASCMQHLYMMPQARASILGAKFYSQNKHEQTLRELQRMFAYLMESERKAYNPRSFCKVYEMDHQPLNTGEQKDMAEFFIDLVSKLEEMTPELQKLIKTLFCGVTSNNVVSLDCPHVSRTLEEFYTVRCQVSDMRTVYDSLNEVTVKDTLEGDNMYTCSQCGKKVRAEKRACFKKLPKILCFNTMRYTFNMITMMKEKVNTHFSFPLHLDMSGYVEKTLMPQQYQEEKIKKLASKKEGEEDGNSGAESDAEEDECLEYDLIGVTVHTGTADGGHYYSFIRDRVPPNKDKWYLFNDAEVKPFDPSQIASECFGGEMSTKTYDSVTDKFMDLSFEKTNSAYMLFYERRLPSAAQFVPGEGSLVPSLPGGSSQRQHQSQAVPTQTFELSKELEDWIWQDNTHFLEDKNIFEHTYFNFMWQVCGYLPQSLTAQEDVSLLAAKLSVTFFLETFIHAKEKPTMVQWVELLTKQLSASQTAAAWLLDHMGETDWWPVQILLKCSNQIVRQMFQRLCIHVIQQVSRGRHVSSLYPKPFLEQPGDPDALTIAEYSNYSCVTRFIKRLLSLLEHGAKSYLKNLTEYFTLLHDFSKLGDEECLFLINMEAITVMVNFYLGKKEDPVEHGSEEEEEEEEVVCIPAEKNRVASLEKMIALVAILVEKSRDDSNLLKLAPNDLHSLRGSVKGTNDPSFQFILQQIRDGINFQSTRNMIFSLCRYNDPLARDIVAAIISAIRKHPEVCHPFFKVLNLLAEMAVMPPGMPPFTELVLAKIFDVSEMCPYPTLEWLSSQVPRNKSVQLWCLETMGSWVEHFLISHSHHRVRNGAAALLVALVPNQSFRQGYRSTKIYSAHHCKEVYSMTPEAIATLHNIYLRLLNLLKPAKHYTDAATHGTSKLTCYFTVLTYFTVSKVERLMFGQYFMDLWNLFHPKLSEPAIACHHNKQSLLHFWHHVLLDCPENVQRILQNSNVTKHIAFNYILADHDEQEVVMFNRTMLPAYYAILRMCCTASRHFSNHLARHQNISWAFKNISPFPTQYPAAVDELMKLMKIFVTRLPDATDQEIDEIVVFKRNTLQLYLSVLDGSRNWTTLISAFRILIETLDDRFFVVCNNGLNLMFDALHSLHTMHHEATACHVTQEIVELLNLLTGILIGFRGPKDMPHGPQFVQGNVPIQRIISTCKEWPEVLRKLATFLNTYNNADLRAASIETLTEFLYILPVDTLRTLVPLMIHCHSAYQDGQNAGIGGPVLGPCFPKRNHHGQGVTIKPSVRPPRPMLQMAIPHINRENALGLKGSDEEFDQQLRDFYCPYHVFVDTMCRFAFMKDYITQELVTLSVMMGYESVPLRFIHFPKLWIEVKNSSNIDRKYLQMLVNTTYFADYVELIITQERLSLHHDIVYKFLKSFVPLAYEKVMVTPEIANAVSKLCLDLRNVSTKKVVNLEESAMRIMTDLKALSLLYSPSSYGKPVVQIPLPAPAPSTPQVITILQGLYAYVNAFVGEKISDFRNGKGETPPKRRRLNEEGKEDVLDIPNEPCTSKGITTGLALDQFGRKTGQLRTAMEYDLLSGILGLIASLCKKLGAELIEADKAEEQAQEGTEEPEVIIPDDGPFPAPNAELPKCQEENPPPLPSNSQAE